MNIGQITDTKIYIKPSKQLKKFLRTNKINEKQENEMDQYLLTEDDCTFIKTLELNEEIETFNNLPTIKQNDIENVGKLLDLKELRQLFHYLQEYNKNHSDKIYLHELIEGSAIILPTNAKISRNPELEKRCEKLRTQQQNKEYHEMVKNVSTKREFREDTIGYQMVQMNRHLIAIFQFILSVLAGFAFGFLGIELIIGNLDFGFRLLLGIICALIIALAELYFLAKKLK